MKKDYWVYQERDSAEPWAVHVYGFRDYLNLAFYAEYIPAKTRKYLHVPLTYGDLLKTFEGFATEYDIGWTTQDLVQVTELWQAIRQDWFVLFGKEL